MQKKYQRKILWVGAVFLLLGLSVLPGYYLLTGDHSLRQNEHRHKFGAVYMTLNNPFYEIIDEEIRSAVENNGDILLSRDPALSVKRQTEEIQELIDSGVEVLFLNAVDWKEIGAALAIAQQAHVPVIAIDTNVEDDSLVAATIVSDNYQAGADCARHLAAHNGGGNIVLLEHTEAKSAVDRIRGFTDAILDYPSFHIIDRAECKGQLELAMPAMEKMLAKNQQIDIVMALNDPAALGAMAALKNAGQLQRILVYGVDGAPETKEMIAAGHMTATAMQSPRTIGRIAVQRAYEIRAGILGEKLIKLPTELLTHESIGRYPLERWD